MTTAFTFAPASKAARKARIALAGPTGGGKTMTALILATNLADRVAVIDTERGSASLYSGASGFTFDVLEMHTYDPRDLVKALAAAGAAGYGAVVVDSLSHFWEGTGGMLEQVDSAAKRAVGNSFGGWKEARPMERAMIDALLAYPGHVIVTMRTKTEYVVEKDERGKQVPRKIGLKPVQRDGIEYEFDIVGDLDIENTLVITKTRLSALAGEVLRRPDELLAKRILAWLDDGAQLPTVAEYVDRAKAAETADELRDLYREVQQRNLGGAAIQDDKGDTTTLAILIGDYGRALDAVAKAEQHEREAQEQEAAKEAALARQDELTAGVDA
jgi:hypothetical protein